MKGYYEQNRDDDNKLVVITGKDGNFPPHFHLSIEVTLMKHGEQECFINGERYLLTDGAVSIVDSFDVHGYRNATHKPLDLFVLLFPYAYFQRFDAWRKGKTLAKNVFYDEMLCKKLCALTEEYLLPAKQSGNIEQQRAASELFFSILAEKAVFEEKKIASETEFIRVVLQYIQTHYTEDVSRETLAKRFGYSKEYLSRVFRRYVGNGLNEYVNGLRLDYVAQKRAQGDKRTELTLLYEAGFNSYQTYYRVKSQRKKGQ